MPPALLGLLWAAVFAVPLTMLTQVRHRRGPWGGTAWLLAFNFALLFIVDSLAFYAGRPMMTFPGLMPLILVNLAIMLVTVTFGTRYRRRLVRNGGSIAAALALLVFLVVWITGHNSGHNAYRAAHLVSVSSAPGAQMPASSTDHMVVVSPDIATTKASQTMSTGIAGQRDYSTYLQLGTATLQYTGGRMWYVFPLKFDGSGNKARLHAVMPGYIMVSAEDPNAAPVEHYDNQYSMIVGEGGGQGSEPARWAYSHGYSRYLLDDPTLELNDQGLPFYTVTLMAPRLGWTFDAPVGVLVINAHTGQITRYALNAVPDWVDRVYSQQAAETIANWYGKYSQAGFGGAGSSNANRFQVSGTPVMVYTGASHPVWRMLLTSYNSDNSVSKVIEMNAATGAMRLYAPQRAMGTEAPVSAAFDNASGTGASLVKSSHYRAVDLTLHVIYGHLTWMATYEPEGSNASFTGVGFVDAYQATADNVVFGSSKSAALSNYLNQLSAEGTSNGTAPEQGGRYQTVTGTIAAVGWDITGGQKYWYVSLKGKRGSLYVGTVSSVGPALVLAQKGDTVTIRVLNVGQRESTQTMQSFTDSRVPLSVPGS